MGAETIAKALGGRKAGASWMAPCPAHNDREPSLSIKDANGEKLLVHCFAGCEQSHVIRKLQSLGLWYVNGSNTQPASPVRLRSTHGPEGSSVTRQSAA